MIYINLDNQVSTSSLTNTTVPRIVRKRRDHPREGVVFTRRGVQVQLANGSTGICGVKETKDFSGQYLASSEDMVLEGTGTNAVYYFDLPLNTDEINALFTEPALPEVTLALEITWTESGRVLSTVDEITYIIRNDYNQGGEGGPTSGGLDWESPGAYLKKAGNLAGLADQAAARANLGIGGMLDRDLVAVPVDFSSPGQPGQYAYDPATYRLWRYLGGQWVYQTLISA